MDYSNGRMFWHLILACALEGAYQVEKKAGGAPSDISRQAWAAWYLWDSAVLPWIQYFERYDEIPDPLPF